MAFYQIILWLLKNLWYNFQKRWHLEDQISNSKYNDFRLWSSELLVTKHQLYHCADTISVVNLIKDATILIYNSRVVM